MRTALFALLLLPLAPAGAAPFKPAQPCKAQPQVAQSRQGARIQPLGAMPPAKQLFAVYREVGGCTEPVVLRRQVGAPARR